MKQMALVTEVPVPRAMRHECGAPAVESFYFSPRYQKVISVIICSACHPSFYPKAKKLPASVGARAAQGAA